MLVELHIKEIQILVLQQCGSHGQHIGSAEPSGEKTKVKVEYENSDAKGSPGACGWSGMLTSHHLVII